MQSGYARFPPQIVFPCRLPLYSLVILFAGVFYPHLFFPTRFSVREIRGFERKRERKTYTVPAALLPSCCRKKNITRKSSWNMSRPFIASLLGPDFLLPVCSGNVIDSIIQKRDLRKYTHFDVSKVGNKCSLNWRRNIPCVFTRSVECAFFPAPCD